MRVCWNAIVRNESARIVRCMQSLIEHIDCAVVLDTGSTDDTIELIKDFFEMHRKPVEVYRHPFDDFSQSRNRALFFARESNEDFDYILLCDADMELVGAIPAELTCDYYNVVQKVGSLEYYNTRLLKRDADARYVGVTHEYLSTSGSMGYLKLADIHFLDHADGANRADKFQRDIRMLSKALNDEPNNPRYWFYLAQSHRDAGELDAALTAYRKRVELGGWEEEVWNAQINIAGIYKDMGDEDGFVRESLKAYAIRPQRAETTYELAKYFREKDKPVIASLFARIAQETPKPNDVLFLNDYVYSVGADEEMSVAGFYNPLHRKSGFRACDFVAVGKHGLDNAAEQARANLLYYLPTAKQVMPSFSPKPIPQLAGWRQLNPSIANVGGEMFAVLRTVNYVITPDGRYDIDGKGGDITADNPIRTQNYLLELDRELEIKDWRQIVVPPGNDFPLVRGWEDMRLWKPSYGPDLSQLHVSATVRDRNSGGACEQWYGRLDWKGGAEANVVAEKKLPSFQAHEKNWMPIEGRREWVYQLGKVYRDGKIEERRCPVNPTHMRGSSQVIGFGGNYLCIVHEAAHRRDNGQRFYFHRWVLLDTQFNVIVVSPPFCFHDKQIEFCAGLSTLGTTNDIVISYGVQDREAWFATVKYHDVIKALTHAD